MDTLYCHVLVYVRMRLFLYSSITPVLADFRVGVLTQSKTAILNYE